MDIRRLQFFMRVAELGSVNAVAEKVHLGQPSLSRQIRLLEEELGISLFSRNRDGMLLTPEGHELRMRIGAPLRQLELALADMKCLADRSGGVITLGIPGSVVGILASPLMKRARATAPNILLHIIEEYPENLLISMGKDEIDLAITNGSPVAPPFETEDILIEDLMVIGPPDCDLSPDIPMSLEQIGQLPLILPSPKSHPHEAQQNFDWLAQSQMQSPQFLIYADSLQLRKAYVQAGLGYTLQPLSSFAAEAATGSLKYAPIRGVSATRRLTLAINWNRNPRATAIIRRLIYEEVMILKQQGKLEARLLFDRAPD